MTTELSAYPEIDASALVEADVLDIIKNPIDGTDHHLDIPWGKIAEVSIQAYYWKNESNITPRHRLIVYFKRNHHKPVPFIIGHQENGNFSVATVSGSNAGLAELSYDQSAIMAELLMSSLDTSTKEN